MDHARCADGTDWQTAAVGLLHEHRAHRSTLLVANEQQVGQLMSKRTLDFVPPQSYFDLRRPAYFCIPCLSWSADDPTVSLEGTANNALPTRTFAGQPFIFDKEIAEGPEMHLLPTPCTLGNPAAIRSQTDVYDDILAKLAWGNLYFYYGEPLGMQHELPPSRMYPITVTDVRGSCVSGQERIVTALDGVYGWRGERCLHLVYRYDRRGRRIGHDFVTTIDSTGARTAVDLDDREMAIVVQLPVIVESATPVNVIVTRCDEQTIELSIHGEGSARITGPAGKTQVLSLTGAQQLTIMR